MTPRDTAAGDIAQAAHDLNNLCTCLVGFAALAKECAPPVSALSMYIDEIRASAADAVVLAGRLSAISERLRRGGSDL